MDPIKTPSTSTSSNTDELGFQYIVVGGGAAGCPLAASLAKKGRTLLLERGKPKENEADSRSCCLDKAVKWNRTESGSWAACANVLGGGSAVNAGVFLKETRDGRFFKQHDFLQWDQVEKAYAEVSEKVSNERGPIGDFQDALTQAMKDANLGHEDVRTDTAHVGVYHPNSLFNAQGERNSATRLLPTIDDESYSNLTIWTNVLVTRILFDTHSNPPRAIGIEYRKLDDGNTSTQQLNAPEASYYLSGGALHTPQLMMLSGIGDAEKLTGKNIEVIVDNPHVGQHLKDKVVIPITVISGLPMDHTIAETMAMTEDFQIGTVSGGRIATHMVTLTLGVLPAKCRSSTKRRVAEKAFQLLPRPLLKRLNQQFTLYIINSNPISEGSVSLSSTDPQDGISISNPGLSDLAELIAMAKGITMAEKVICAAPLQKYRRDLVSPWSTMVMRRVGQLYSAWYKYGDKSLKSSRPVTFPMLPSVESLSAADMMEACDEKSSFPVSEDMKRWLQGVNVEGWNYVGTCRVGDVVNDDFTVKGVNGLSIVDASILSSPPRVNSQATMMMLGLYAGKMARCPL